MASAPTEGYRFHHLCGRRAKISNHSRTAERTQSRGEFNNAVVITSQPLRDREALQVKIDSKVPTWTGSVLIGATSTPPGNFTFPPSISGLANASWVCNGECVWRNGEKILNSYSSQRLASLNEGATVGVVRRGSCLHFLVNGKDLGVAEMHLPFSRVYGIIDIYGQCTKVTIVESAAGPSDAQPAAVGASVGASAGDVPRFHRRAGNLVEVGEGGMVALRKNCLGEFNHGVVLTDRALRPSELFEVEIMKMVDKWAGSIEIGVTTHSPEELDFPSTMTNLHTGTWIMSGTGVMHNGDTIRENYGRSLDTLKKGEKVGVMRRDNGDLVFFVNGRELGVAAMDLPREVYGVVDMYGQCAEVRITQAESSDNDDDDARTNQLENTAGHQVSEVDSPLRFHETCGENAEISTDGLSASRMQPYDEFTRATVFTHRPLRANEWFQVRVGVFIDCWSGSVQLGVCKAPPSELTFDDFEEISDVESAWVLSGAELFHGGSPVESDYPLDLDEIPMGSKIAVMVTSAGDIHFALDGVDMGSAAKDIPNGVYGVVDVYGQCAHVDLVPFGDNTEAGHVTTTPPTRPVAVRTAVTPDIIPTSEGVAPVIEASSTGPLDRGFHPRCGRNIQLTESLCVATRLNSYKDGVVFSARPLRDGEVFKVELSKLNETWKGVLRIGLTTCDPASFSVVPSLCTGLPPHTWIVSGSSVLADGRVVAENYGMSLSRLQAGDAVGVLRSHSGAMQVCVNDQDLGPAVYGVPENVHAVLDLYGTAHCVKFVSDSGTPMEQSSEKPESVETVDTSSLNSESGAVTFALSCGQNIELSEDRTSAERVKSYSKGIVVSDTPLPNDRLFQVEIKRIESKWSGSVMLGVTSLPPSQACLPDKASALEGESIVLCAHNDTTSVFIAGQEKMRLPGRSNLLSLKAGHTIGILCRLQSLHFFVNGSHVARLTQRIPERRYVVVDLYGQCCKVELKPLVPLNAKLSQLLAAEVVQLQEVDAPRKFEPTQPKQHTVKEKVNSFVPSKDGHYQLPSRAVANGPVASLTGVSNSSKDLTPQQAKQLWAASKHAKLSLQKNGQLSSSGCQYQQLCQNFIKSLLLPEPYFVPEYHKCYCERCAANRTSPRVSYSGEPPRKYTLPFGWAKFAIQVGPQADVLEVFRKWHVAYHGTAVARVRKILDCGELMFPGDMTLHPSEVSQPEGHYTEKCKPRDFDVCQVFVSPSIKYCTDGEVYAKSYGYTDPVTNEMYRAKVAFKLRIQPDSYTVSPQTLLTVEGPQADENFSNSELEWSTKRRKVIILYGLLVKLEPIAGAEHR